MRLFLLETNVECTMVEGYCKLLVISPEVPGRFDDSIASIIIQINSIQRPFESNVQKWHKQGESMGSSSYVSTKGHFKSSISNSCVMKRLDDRWKAVVAEAERLLTNGKEKRERERRDDETNEL